MRDGGPKGPRQTLLSQQRLHSVQQRLHSVLQAKRPADVQRTLVVKGVQ
jgi:hypothetical protein